MPAPTVQRCLDPQERLDQVIRLKRCERPDAAFWTKFEQGIRSKQLSSLVIYQPWYVRAGKTALLVSRKAAPATAAAGVFAIAVAAVTQSGFFASQDQPTPAAAPTIALSAETEPANPLFAVAQEQTTFEPTITIEQQVSREPSAIYRVPVMARSQPATSYELRYAPQTLTTVSSSEAGAAPSSMGAKVISTAREF